MGDKLRDGGIDAADNRVSLGALFIPGSERMEHSMAIVNNAAIRAEQCLALFPKTDTAWPGLVIHM